MKTGKHAAKLWLCLILAVWLTGCSSSPATQPQTAQPQTTAPQTTAQEPGSSETAASAAESQTAEAETDRYEQIISRDADGGKLTMYFLDLETEPGAEDKSGDSTILISPDGKVMLLDAGHTDCGEQVVQVLKDLGVEKIDYLVISHPHIDHIGGVSAVLDAFPVEKLYRTYLEYTTKTYKNFVNAAEDHEVETVYLSKGDEFEFGSQVHVEVFGPEEEIVYPDGFPDNSTQFVNDESLLLKFTFGESTALFGGDLYSSQERDYIDEYGDRLQADVIKANHHGNDTSNTKKWIKTVNPQIVAAMNDKVGSMTVYDNYVKNGAEFHLTFCDGIVKVSMDDKKNYEVTDQKDSWMN